MAVRGEYGILHNEPVNNGIFQMIIQTGPLNIEPGQFVNVTIPGVFLPRPILVANYSQGLLSLIYRVVGEGTELMSGMKQGDNITIMTGLGNGFDLNAKTEKPLIIGGGLGVAPLHYLAVKLKEQGLDPTILLGFKSMEDAFYLSKFQNRLPETEVALESEGKLVTDLLKELPPDSYDYFYTCGPKPMLKVINDIVLTDGEFSLEERMACGIGQCKCCSIQTNDGMKTLCHDGPVLKKGLVRWDSCIK